MPISYEEAGGHLFGEEEFTSDEFARRLGTLRAAKILSELKHRGIVARLGHGRYRFLRPGERPDRRLSEWRRAKRVVLAGPAPKAWTGSTAVELWTGHRYTVSPSVFYRVLELAVPAHSVGHWRSYLRHHRVGVDTRKRVGVRVELSPVRTVHADFVEGEPVIPRRDVVSLIRDHPAIYANAEELLLGKSS
jgi:hypothetical protein